MNPLFLRRGPFGGAKSSSPLVGFFTSFWKLADAADAIGPNTLTVGGTISFAAGKLGNAAFGTGLGTDVLSVTITYPAASDFIVAMWYKTVSASNQYLYDVNNNSGMALTYNGGTAMSNFFTDVGHIASVNQNLADGNWHLLVGWYDAATTKVSLNVDHGVTATSAAGASAPLSGANATRIGSNTTGSLVFNGGIDAVGMGKTKPTQAILDALWNLGNGVEPPF